MALNSLAVTPGTIFGKNAILSTACIDKTGATTTNLVTLYTAIAKSAGGNGAIIQDITFTAPNTTSTTSLAFVALVFKVVGGVYTLIKEIAVAAGTGSTSAVGATSGKFVLNEFISQGDAIAVGTTVTLPVHGSGNIGEY